MKKTLIVVAAIGLIVVGCKKTAVQTYDCTGVAPTYTGAVKAILDTKCATSGCHDAGTKSKGIDLSGYAATKTESSKGAFLGSIQHASGYTAMPQGSSKLDDATIKTLSCWVQNGSPQ